MSAKKKDRKKLELPPLDAEKALEAGADELFGEDDENQTKKTDPVPPKKGKPEAVAKPPVKHSPPPAPSELTVEEKNGKSGLFGVEETIELKGPNNVFGKSIVTAAAINGDGCIYIPRSVLNKIQRLGDEMQVHYHKSARDTANRNMVVGILEYALEDIRQKGESSSILKRLAEM